MERSTIKTKLVDQYVAKYLENSSKKNYDEILENKNVISAFYDELPNLSIDGYPFASDFVSESGNVYSMNNIDEIIPEERQKLRLRYHFLPCIHELYIGTTGSGKTTGCVEPQLRAITSLKNKSNLFITDPKGELYERNVKHLSDNGYKIFVLNFKDYERSDRWNPLLDLYDLKQQILSCGKGIIERVGAVDPNLNYAEHPSNYKDIYYEYKGKAYPSKEACESYVAAEKEMKEVQLSSDINQIVHMIIKVQSKNDRTWEQGAQDLLRGIIYCMLEEMEVPNTKFTRDMMTLSNIKHIYLYLREKVLIRGQRLNTLNFIKNKSEATKSYLYTALDNAESTMKSYCGVFDSSTQEWFQGHIFAMTTGNTINIDELGDTPFAIFLITRDYEKSDFVVAGLFVDWVYKKILMQNEGSQNPRALHFILDEFGNIPEIKELESKISTARSRNIWFHLVVQSYKQINAVYTYERGGVIIDNCNSQIFLGSQNMESKELFAKQCGKHAILTLDAYLHSSVNSLSEVPVIPTSTLDLINPGEMYIKRLYMPVILSQFIRSYICANVGIFKDFYGGLFTKEYAPYSADYYSTKYTYNIRDIYDPKSVKDLGNDKY